LRRLSKICVVALACAGLSTAVRAAPAFASGNPFPLTPVAGFSTSDGNGFWLTYADGAVSTNGSAAFHGDASQLALAGPVVGGAVARSGSGYWLVASDGGIFTYGSAQFFGSTGALHLNQPVFSMAPSKLGNGYWLVARDGGIFTFGDAHFYGSTGGIHLSQPIIGITTSPTGKGYRMVAKDGGIFSFGDVPFYGSLPSRGLHTTDVVGMASTPTGKGYWIARADGTVYNFGDAGNFGLYTRSQCDPIVGIFSNPKRQGYRLLMQSGATVAFFQSAPGGGKETGIPVQCVPTSSDPHIAPPPLPPVITHINDGSTEMTRINGTTVRWSLRVDRSNGITEFVGPVDQKIGVTKRVPLRDGGDVVMTVNNFGSGLTWTDGID
jgi:hypothetical protein